MDCTNISVTIISFLLIICITLILTIKQINREIPSQTIGKNMLKVSGVAILFSLASIGLMKMLGY